MKKKVIAGLVLSALLVYLSVRGIDFQGVADGFRTIRYGYLLPVLAAMFLMQLLQVLPLGAYPEPAGEDRSALAVLRHQRGLSRHHRHPGAPGRAGPPLSHHEKEPHPKMSSALGTIFVERVLDSLTVLIIAVFVLFFTPLPPWLVRSSVLFLLVTLALRVGNDPDDRQARGVAPDPGPAHRKAAGALCRGS